MVGYGVSIDPEIPDDKRENAGTGRKAPISSVSVSPPESRRVPRPALARALGVLKRFPLKTFCVVLVACAVVREQFPFSHFPMYDHFPDHTFYVFVKDGAGQPVPLETVTGKRTANFKKPYDKELDGIRKALRKRKRELTAAEREPAGRRALENLYTRAPEAVQRRLEALSPLHLYHAEILMVEGVIVEPEPERVATLALPPASPPPAP